MPSSKPTSKLGLKRLCHSCATLYYDMKKAQPVCPKCGASYAPENTLKASRNNDAPSAKRVEKKVVSEEDIAVLEEDDDEESYIEDPEELGDDGDVIDVAATGDRDDV